MRYIFWQNILSIHQASFLNNLSQGNDVVLVVEKEAGTHRAGAGWHIPDFGNTEIIVSPGKDKVDQLLDGDSVHLFSGINTYPLSTFAFNLAVRKRLKVGVLLEPFNWLGWKGYLRFLRYFFLRIKYGAKISFILAIGDGGRRCYEKVGFKKKKIFDWGYFTFNVPPINVSPSPNVTMLFIGSIDKRKNIIYLADACKNLKNQDFNLNIIGKGPLLQELSDSIKNSPNIHYLGGVLNSEISHYISQADILVLPSIFDGWGAVVNEALMCGTPVIASNNCGASVLLDGDWRGEIFSVENNDLEEILEKWVSKGKLPTDTRQNIKEWAENNISGKAASQYFLDIMSCVFDNAEKPVAPWIKNK